MSLAELINIVIQFQRPATHISLVLPFGHVTFGRRNSTTRTSRDMYPATVCTSTTIFSRISISRSHIGIQPSLLQVQLQAA